MEKRRYLVSNYPIQKGIKRNRGSHQRIYSSIRENPRFHIQLSANYDTEKAEWNQFLEDNQWKLYPLLRNILNVFLPPHESGYRILYTLYPEGFLSVIAEPLKSEEA